MLFITVVKFDGQMEEQRKVLKKMNESNNERLI